MNGFEGLECGSIYNYGWYDDGIRHLLSSKLILTD